MLSNHKLQCVLPFLRRWCFRVSLKVTWEFRLPWTESLTSRDVGWRGQNFAYLWAEVDVRLWVDLMSYIWKLSITFPAWIKLSSVLFELLPHFTHAIIIIFTWKKLEKRVTCVCWKVTAKSAGYLPAFVFMFWSAPSWRSFSTASSLPYCTAIDNAWQKTSVWTKTRADRLSIYKIQFIYS